MFSKFNEEAQKTLIMSKKEMQELKHPYVGSEHLLLAILRVKTDLTKKLNELGIEYKKVRQELIELVGIGKEENNWFLYTPLLKRVIENSSIIVKEENTDVTQEHLLISILEEGEGVAIRILSTLGVDISELYNYFSTKIVNKNKKQKKNSLEEYGINLNKQSKENKIDPVIGREEETKRIIEILSRRTKNNPLLIGDAGVGKTAIVEEIANLIVNGKVPNNLKNSKIISISISSLVAGTKYRGEFEERINKILKELESDQNTILFIDELHTIIGAGGAEGAIDASNIIKPALARGKIKIIGATTTEEYKQFIEKDKAFDRRFQIIKIDEPDEEKTIKILQKLKPIYENYHNVIIEDEVINKIVKLTNKYIHNRKQPDKAIDILDEACVRTSLKENNTNIRLHKLKEELDQTIATKNKKIIAQDFEEASILKFTEKELEDKINKLELKSLKAKTKLVKINTIEQIINNKTGVELKIINNTKENLNNLKHKLSKTIKGQEEAINELINTTKRIQLGFKRNDKPISFLFVGPSGTGKTLLAKEYSNYIYGVNKIIKIDMSEFSEAHSISKLIGSPPGYIGFDNTKTKFEEIKENPNSILLLDEIDKANPSIINLFLQILEEGKITDSKGNTIKFDNYLIIMTSNAGINNSNIGFNKCTNKAINNNINNFFSIEFINRIDNIINFNILTKETIEKIVKEKLQEAKKIFKEKGIIINIKPEVVNEIINESNYEKYGARKIEKIIDNKINMIAIEALIDGKKKLSIKTIN